MFEYLQVQRLDIYDPAAVGYRLQPDFVHTVHDTSLLFSGNVHNIEGEELARDLGEADVQMYLHLFSCNPIESAKFIAVLYPISSYLAPYQQSTRDVRPPVCNLSIPPAQGIGQ